MNPSDAIVDARQGGFDDAPCKCWHSSAIPWPVRPRSASNNGALFFIQVITFTTFRERTLDA